MSALCATLADQNTTSIVTTEVPISDHTGPKSMQDLLMAGSPDEPGIFAVESSCHRISIDATCESAMCTSAAIFACYSQFL